MVLRFLIARELGGKHPDTIGDLGVLRSKHVDLHGRGHDGTWPLELELGHHRGLDLLDDRDQDLHLCHAVVC